MCFSLVNLSLTEGVSAMNLVMGEEKILLFLFYSSPTGWYYHTVAFQTQTLHVHGKDPFFFIKSLKDYPNGFVKKSSLSPQILTGKGCGHGTVEKSLNWVSEELDLTS